MEPAGAPICWGRQYEDGNDECNNCKFSDSCRPAAINRSSMRRNGVQQQSLPQPRISLPVLPQQSYMPTPQFGVPQIPTLPQPSNYPRTVLPHSPIPQMAQQGHPQSPVGFQPHAPASWNTPIAYLPKPNPANPSWWQYSGETTSSRLGKNIVISALQAIFAELLRFFTNWTWPTSLGTT